MLNQRSSLRGRWCIALIVLVLVCAGTVRSETRQVEASIVQRTVDGVYVDVGRAAGLTSGTRGRILRGEAMIGTVQVSTVSGSSALLQVLTVWQGEVPQVGDKVVFDVEEAAVTEKPASSSSTLKNPDAATEPFVPLLAPMRERSVNVNDPSNIFHGRIWMRQSLQMEQEQLADYSLSRVGTAGSLERINGTPWAVDWNANLSYRSGDGLSNSRYYQEPRLDLRQLSLFRRFDGGSFVRAGRFLPLELPSVGYLDGAQAEVVLNKNVRVGGMAGLKPDRYDLEFTTDEPTAVAYGTFQAGEMQRLYYSGTLGVLGSAYQGSFDRLAVLLDQTATLGPHLNLYSSSEVDIDAGGAEERDGASLTRLNLHANAPVNKVLSFRTGVDHYQQPDTAAERAVYAAPTNSLPLDDGYWRYSIGSAQRVPGNLTFDEEVSFLEGENYSMTPLWRLGITRRGFFDLKNSSLSMTVYNMESSYSKGYGVRLYGYFPVMQSRLSFQPSVGFRTYDENGGVDSLDLSDASLLVDWLISRKWSANVQVSESFGTSVQALYIDSGLTYRW
ncbi:MAG: hypothetical protein K9M54_00185 [Kiritimatiellales bacterium]|nr:hypothetical protein [Kiritimatiellales bacterium]